MTAEVEYQRDQARILEGLKTVVIFDDMTGDIMFFVVDGDKRSWNGKYEHLHNVGYPDDGFYDLCWNEGERRQGLEEFPTVAVLEGAFVVVCGLLP